MSTKPVIYRRLSTWRRFCVWADINPIAAPIIIFAFCYVGVIAVLFVRNLVTGSW